MGLVHAEIELINRIDLAMAAKYEIGEEEIKRITVTALVDSGSFETAINQNIQEYLQIPIIGRKRFEMADGTVSELDIVSPLDIRFMDRDVTTRAVVLPGNSEVLLGMIPMEAMDLIIDAKRQELAFKRHEWIMRL